MSDGLCVHLWDRQGGGGGGLGSPNGVGRRSKRLQPTSAGEDLLLVEVRALVCLIILSMMCALRSGF